MAVLVGEHHLVGRQLPVDVKVRIVPGNSALGLRGIIVVTLILEDGGRAKDRKAVSEATWDKKLTVIFVGEKDREIAAKGR